MSNSHDLELHQPVFVVGFPRSGTTLLAAILARAPAFSVPPETLFCRRMIPCGVVRDPDEAFTDFEGVLRRARDDYRLKDLGLDWDGVRELLRGVRPTYRNLFASILESYRRSKGAARIVEKSPVHLPYVPLLREWFPSASIVSVERDGRAVIHSLEEVPWNQASPVWNAVRWNRWIALTEEFERRFDSGFLRVRYESLVREPLVTLRRVSDFVGEYLGDEHLTPRDTEVVPEWESEWKGRVEESLDPSRVDRWRDSSPSGSQRIAYWLMSENLERLEFEADRGGVQGRAARVLVSRVVEWLIDLREILRRLWCRTGFAAPPWLSGRRTIRRLAGASDSRDESPT